MNYRKRPRRHRKGAAAVEFALVAPLFVLMFFGIVEIGRGMMVQQVLIQASREGAREAALPGATMDSVMDVVERFAADAGTPVNRNDISAIPDPASALNNQQIKVSVEVAVSDISWIPSSFLPARLKATTTMRSEGLD
jgi:Flp pilus assembly protein TadG